MFIQKGILYFSKIKNNLQIKFRKKSLDCYFIKIMGIYKNEIHQNFIVRFYVATCGITQDILYSELINSPLIYAIHPKQIIFLTKQCEKNSNNHDDFYGNGNWFLH